MGAIMSPAEMQADIAERVAGLDPDSAARFRLAVEFTLEAAGAVLGAPEAERASLYRAAVAEGKARGLDMGGWPECYGPAAETTLWGMGHVAANAELVIRGVYTAH